MESSSFGLIWLFLVWKKTKLFRHSFHFEIKSILLKILLRVQKNKCSLVETGNRIVEYNIASKNIRNRLFKREIET